MNRLQLFLLTSPGKGPASVTMRQMRKAADNTLVGKAAAKRERGGK